MLLISHLRQKGIGNMHVVIINSLWFLSLHLFFSLPLLLLPWCRIINHFLKSSLWISWQSWIQDLHIELYLEPDSIQELINVLRSSLVSYFQLWKGSFFPDGSSMRRNKGSGGIVLAEPGRKTITGALWSHIQTVYRDRTSTIEWLSMQLLLTSAPPSPPKKIREKRDKFALAN